MSLHQHVEVPYPSDPWPQTHPDRLATVETLLGCPPPPPDRCRVSELGCARRWNSSPLALTLPDSDRLPSDLARTCRPLPLDLRRCA